MGKRGKMKLDFYRLREQHADYIEAACYIHSSEEIDHEIILKDTIRRWEFITRWTEKQGAKSKDVLSLKHRSGYIDVKQIALQDEPLCFEDALYPGSFGKCHSCPLWHLDGLKCDDVKSVKFKVVEPLLQGHGDFYPEEMLTLLEDIKAGRPIYDLFDSTTGYC